MQFSIWHWLIVLVVVGIPVALVLKLRRKSPGGEANPSVAGFGGWLLLLAVVLTLGLVRNLAELVQSGDVFAAVLQRPGIFAPFILVFVVLLASLLLHTWTLIAMYGKRKLFLRLFPALWLANGVLALVSFSLLLVPGVTLDHIAAGVGQQIAVFVGMGLWVWYTRASVRVRNTFVA
ncbi:MAG: DUF2569 family protein [Pseudomonadota bacterium]